MLTSSSFQLFFTITRQLFFVILNHFIGAAYCSSFGWLHASHSTQTFLFPDKFRRPVIADWSMLQCVFVIVRQSLIFLLHYLHISSSRFASIRRSVSYLHQQRLGFVSVRVPESTCHIISFKFSQIKIFYF